MREYLTIDMFSEEIGNKLLVHSGGGQILEMQVVSVTDLGSSPRQIQFSVILLGPVTAPIQQGNYRIEHDKLGPRDLFLVPIGMDKDGVRYQAIFNRFIE